MMIRGVRGAITVSENSAEAIWSATQEVLQNLIDGNGIQEDDVASIMFTTTPDFSAAYPAMAARMMGWSRTALMGFAEADIDDGLTMCIRILIHWNTNKTFDEIQHVFLQGAEVLRPDLANKELIEEDN
jgi:chorismate mutase